MDDSPTPKKPNIYQEANRPTYSIFKGRLLNSKYKASLECAALRQLHELFVKDYERFKGEFSSVAAGYLLSHVGIRRCIGHLRASNRGLFDELPECDEWVFLGQ